MSTLPALPIACDRLQLASNRAPFVDIVVLAAWVARVQVGPGNDPGRAVPGAEFRQHPQRGNADRGLGEGLRDMPLLLQVIGEVGVVAPHQLIVRGACLVLRLRDSHLRPQYRLDQFQEPFVCQMLCEVRHEADDVPGPLIVLPAEFSIVSLGSLYLVPDCHHFRGRNDTFQHAPALVSNLSNVRCDGIGQTLGGHSLAPSGSAMDLRGAVQRIAGQRGRAGGRELPPRAQFGNRCSACLRYPSTTTQCERASADLVSTG